MSYLVLARKYRPQTFEDVVKQGHVTQTLANAITSKRVAHAILFSGPRGTGKTTIARILAKSMNCEQGPTPMPCNKCRSCKEITSGSAADVFEIDGASNNGVDHIRELRENIRYMPNHSRYKIYIIDEVHMLSTPAFNALLKTLEEPPAHIMFLFATTEPQKIPITILSRCQRHDLRRIELDAVTNHMANLCNKEQVEITQESLELISRESGGSMRDALSLLDQVMTCAQGNISHEQIIDILGVVDRKILFDMSAAIFQGNVPAILELIDNIYDHGHNLNDFYVSLTEHFRNLLVVKMTQDAAKLVDVPFHEINLMNQQVKNVSELFLTQILDVLFKEETTIKFSTQPRLALEMAFIKMFQIKPALPIEKLIEKLDDLSKGVYEEPVNLKVQPVNMVKEPVTYEMPVSAPAHKTYNLPKISKEIEIEQDNLLEKEIKTEESFEPIIFDPADSLDQTWEKLKTLIFKKSSALGASLNKCTLKNQTDTELEISIQGNGFNIKQIRKKESLIKETCDEFFGKQMKIAINPVSSQNKAKKITKEQKNTKEQEALNHPLTDAALEIFNAKLVQVKIL